MPSNANLASSEGRNTAETRKEETDEASKMTILESPISLNPFINDFVDCIENLPNRLQLVLTELRNIDAQVNGTLILIQS